ncbi:hypothetical protein CVT26_007192 [Gymnopilus dilepis]|uniref:Uncharacterized protein n=1 Tax=Gymnopilus dilepis TaxID=231916 RepID=A0A409X102_9AGAR|nr:hypothetical protein CVT26_007192 [Gymnopilus dilepis]
MHQEALELCPAPHPDRWASLANLGNCLRVQTGSSAVIDHVEEAISLHREAISLCSTSNPSYSALIRFLVSDYELHFRETHSEQSLNEAIVLYRQLADLTTDKAEQHSWALKGLSKKLQQRFALHGNPQDLKAADEIDNSLTRDQGPTVTSAKAEV